jgi:O-acetyl-ADP-ribose deacetylase (regulator of RNase III)
MSDGSFELESLKNWTSEAVNASSPETPTEDSAKAVFPIDDEINNRIYLWEGQIWRLRVDAILNTTNESMMDQSGLSGMIHQHAGPQLAEEVMQKEGCRTGECRVTRAYLLPCKKIIHTVGPRYNERYKTAAESALHYCYRNTVEEAVENKLRLPSILFSLKSCF